MHVSVLTNITNKFKNIDFKKTNNVFKNNTISKKISAPLKVGVGTMLAYATGKALNKNDKLSHDERNFVARMSYIAEKYRESFDKNIYNEEHGISERYPILLIKEGQIPEMYEKGEISHACVKELFAKACNAISHKDGHYFAKKKIPLTSFDDEAVLDARYYNAVTPKLRLDNPEISNIKTQIIKEETEKINNCACDRKMILVTGLPAAGKTTITKNLLGDSYSKYYCPDPDEFKAKFEPYYNSGKGSNVVHQVSVDIMYSPEIMSRVYKEGRNIIKQTVASAPAIRKIIKEAQDKGYTVQVVHVNVTPEQAQERAVKRFEKDGRFLDPLFINELYNHSVAYNKVVKNLAETTNGVEIFEYNNIGKNPKLMNHFISKND